MKAFVFTLDSFMGLAIAIAATAAVFAVAQASSADHKMPALAALARDYLVVKYAFNKTISPPEFQALTGKRVYQSFPPSNATLARVDIFVFPALSDCVNLLACSFSNSSTQASNLQKYDGDKIGKYFAWVGP